MAKMTDTGCSQCDESIIEYGKQCPKHYLEYLEWCVQQAYNKYMEELRTQLRKGTKNEKL